MPPPEIKNSLTLSDLNKKVDDLLIRLQSVNPILFEKNLNDFLEDLETFLPGGDGITPDGLISEVDHQIWKRIHEKLKEIGRIHPESLSRRYYKLMVILVLHVGINDDFFSSKI